MAKVKDNGKGMYAFYCPGCGHNHVYWTSGQEAHKWDFNGDLEKPTFSPSLLNRWGNKVPGYEHLEHGGQCHLFVTDGLINYCGDCTHDHNGKQGVEMKEF